jgi:CoA:oxalate CoA-transferase
VTSVNSPVTMPRPLDRIRVLDLANGVAGASSTRLLAELGAEIIKVENPVRGDHTRTLVPYVFESFNRSKRSLAVDLKEADGVALVKQLAAGCDVFVHSMRPGAVEELGLSYEEVTKASPNIIYASFSAFGESGPSSHRRGVDAVVQAESGMAVAQGRAMDNLSFIDTTGGLALSQAILAALIGRERFGTTGHIHVNLLDSALYMQSVPIAEFSVNQQTVDDETFRRRFPTVGIFSAGDGDLYIGGYWDREWAAICDLLARPDLLTDRRFANPTSRAANVTALREELNTEFASRTRAELVTGLEARGVLAGVANTYADVLRDEQVRSNGSLEDAHTSRGEPMALPRRPYRFLGQPMAATAPAPCLGADTRSLLSDELGIPADEQGRLEARGVIGFPAP